MKEKFCFRCLKSFPNTPKVPANLLRSRPLPRFRNRSQVPALSPVSLLTGLFMKMEKKMSEKHRQNLQVIIPAGKHRNKRGTGRD